MLTIFALKDIINASMALVIAALICRSDVSRKELYFLLAHIFLALLINGVLIDPSYMPDQLRYLNASKMIRDGNLSTLISEESLTVAVAGLMFSLMPIPFIISVKSIAIINALLYIFFYVKVIRPIEGGPNYFYLCYPSLVLYSSLALRDMIILMLMLLFVYAGFLKVSRLRMFAMPAIILLSVLKFQNALLLIVFWVVFKLMQSKGIIKLLYFVFSVVMAFLAFKFIGIDKIEWYRRAMYIEDGGMGSPLPDLTVQSFFLGALYFVIKPLPQEASGLFQLIQSFENVVIIFILAKIIIDQIKNRLIFTPFGLAINIFLISSMLLYGMVVFNFGSAARYRFALITVYVLCSKLIAKKNTVMKKESFNNMQKCLLKNEYSWSV